MAPSKQDDLRVVEPLPVSDETTPLLGSEVQGSNGSLEQQAEHERREHDANTTPIPDEPSRTKLVLTMGSLWMCTFFAALDSTIVATLSGPISASFDSMTLFSWLASGYLITNAAFQPLSGKLTDIYGRRAGLIFAVTFFSAGTLLCGLAQAEWVIILGRLVAGAGGGCHNTISVFVASDLIPLRKRGVWQGFGNIVFGAGMGLGGVFGGFINDRIGWRYAFYVQVPFIILGGILACYVVDVPIKETDQSKIKRVDFLGAITLSATLVLFLLGLNSGGNLVPWHHPLVYVPLSLSLVSLLLFIFVEDRVASEPIIPVRLLLNRSVAGACLANWFLTMSTYSILYYVPIFYQTVMEQSSTSAGLRLIPHAVGTAVGSLSAGLLMRATGKYILLNLAEQIVAIVATAAILGSFNAGVDMASPFILLFLSGLANGSIITVMLICMIAAVDHKHQAVITAASYAFRSTGSTIGITISSTLLQNLLKDGLWTRFGSSPGAADEIRRIRDSVDEIHNLPPGWHDGVIDAYGNALRGVWTAALAFSILGALASLFIRQYKLHTNLDRK